MGRRAFVIPDVSAVAETAAAVIVNAFESMKLAIGSAEAGGARERGKIGAGRFLHHGGKRALAKGLREQPGLTFETREILGCVFGGGERGGKSGAIVISDDSFALPFGRCPAAPLGSTIRESPGEKEREVCRTAGRDGALERENANGIMRIGLSGETAVVGEIVPEEHGRIPPAALGPSSPDVGMSAGGIDRAEDEFAAHGIFGWKIRAVHYEAGESVADQGFILPFHWIVD